MQAIASPPAFSCCSASSVSSFRRHQPPSALAPCSGRRKGSSRLVVACLPSSDPLIVQAARGEAVSRPPAWIMRQAGRYMAGFRKLAEQHQSFRKMSETVDLIVEVTLLPWNAFHPDGVIIFSDILTPLPAIGIPFGIDAKKGPFIQSPIRSKEQLKNLNRIDLDKLDFVGKSLGLLRKEVGEEAAVLGFVGAPWTLATYIIEGETSTTHANIKCMSHTAPDLLNDILSHLTKALTEYIIYQIKAGAQYIQIFDSWGGQLPPNMWDIWSKPYIAKMVTTVKKAYPQIPLALYLTGSGGLLEKMQETGVDVIGLDWTVDMTDGRRRLGDAISIQGNIDPLYLFSPLTVVSEEILRVVQCAGPKGHILNLGRGIMPNTPEDTVAHFFETVRDLSYDKIFGDSATEQQPKSAKQTHKVPVKQ